MRREGGWNGKEEWKASKWHREETGERATVLIEIFFSTQGDLRKKAKHFFGEEIEQEEA